MRLAVTGHRPEKLGGYNNPEASAELTYVAGFILAQWRPERTYVGMAQGWDTAVAFACVLGGHPWVACVPFAGQERAWPEAARNHYHWLLARANAVEVVCEGGFQSHKMQLRNEHMVDQADALLACWDGTSGGTFNCVRYAQRRAVWTYNCYADLDPSVIRR